MKPLPLAARTHNRTQRDFCRWCGNDGIVVAQTRNAQAGAWAIERGIHPPAGSVYEEMAPCPYCELGFKLEFQEKGVWAPDGFWRGRDEVDLIPLHPTGQPQPLPLGEARTRARELARAVVGHFADPA